MAKFIYTVVFTAVILWALLYLYALKIPPENFVKIMGFLTILEGALLLTITVPLYFYLYKKAPKMTSLRKIYRNTLKPAAVVSSFIVINIAFKAFDVFSLFNAAMVGLIYYLIYAAVFKK